MRITETCHYWHTDEAGYRCLKITFTRRNVTRPSTKSFRYVTQASLDRYIRVILSDAIIYCTVEGKFITRHALDYWRNL